MNANDPVSDELRTEFVRIEAALTALNTDIKHNPDPRYDKQKQLRKEFKDLSEAVCEHLDNGAELKLGLHLFKKKTENKTTYSKSLVQAFLEKHGGLCSEYVAENSTERALLTKRKRTRSAAVGEVDQVD